MHKRIKLGTLATLILLTAPGLAQEDRAKVADQSARGPSPATWLEISSQNFRVYFVSDDDALANETAVKAESVRSKVYGDLFAQTPQDGWRGKCDIYIHRTVKSFQVACSPRASTPGYSRVTLRGNRVISRRIDLLADGSDLVDAVLPHEISHVILASEFTDQPPPLWVDEGLAVLAEKESMKRAHERSIEQAIARGTWLSSEQLIGMKDYPAEELRDLFYAESVSLVEFLVSRRDARYLVDFARAAAQKGVEAELLRAYGFTSFRQLDQSWSRHIGSTLAVRRKERGSGNRYNRENALTDMSTHTAANR